MEKCDCKCTCGYHHYNCDLTQFYYDSYYSQNNRPSLQDLAKCPAGRYDWAYRPIDDLFTGPAKPAISKKRKIPLYVDDKSVKRARNHL